MAELERLDYELHRARKALTFQNLFIYKFVYCPIIE